MRGISPKEVVPIVRKVRNLKTSILARYNKHVPSTIVEQSRVGTQLGGIAGVLATQPLLVRIQTNRGVREIQT